MDFSVVYKINISLTSMTSPRKQWVSQFFALGITCCLLLCLSACAFKKTCDPFEGVNRGVFYLNKAVDRAVLRPAARIYETVIPCFIQARINSFFQNLGEIPTVANDILQGDFCNASKDAWRFLLNSTFGIGGLFDIAQGAGFPRHYADFGQTLGKWGYKESVYIVLPFFGPSTVRDTIGRAGTYAMSVWPYLRPESLSWTLYAINVLDTRASYFKIEPAIECSAVDEYVFFRDAYLQKRAIEISGSNSDPLENVTSETTTLQGPPA